MASRLRTRSCRRGLRRPGFAVGVASLTSWCAEGFPNVIGEAMACGVPCVVTDVGDAGRIVGRTGRVVPARDPEALAAAWRSVLRMDADARRALGDAARRKVLAEYKLPDIIARYEAVYRDVLDERRTRPRSSVAVGWRQPHDRAVSLM